MNKGKEMMAVFMQGKVFDAVEQAKQSARKITRGQINENDEIGKEEQNEEDNQEEEEEDDAFEIESETKVADNINESFEEEENQENEEEEAEEEDEGN